MGPKPISRDAGGPPQIQNQNRRRSDNDYYRPSDPRTVARRDSAGGPSRGIVDPRATNGPNQSVDFDAGGPLRKNRWRSGDNNLYRPAVDPRGDERSGEQACPADPRHAAPRERERPTTGHWDRGAVDPRKTPEASVREETTPRGRWRQAAAASDREESSGMGRGRWGAAGVTPPLSGVATMDASPAAGDLGETGDFESKTLAPPSSCVPAGTPPDYAKPPPAPSPFETGQTSREDRPQAIGTENHPEKERGASQNTAGFDRNYLEQRQRQTLPKDWPPAAGQTQFNEVTPPLPSLRMTDDRAHENQQTVGRENYSEQQQYQTAASSPNAYRDAPQDPASGDKYPEQSQTDNRNAGSREDYPERQEASSLSQEDRGASRNSSSGDQYPKQSQTENRHFYSEENYPERQQHSPVASSPPQEDSGASQNSASSKKYPEQSQTVPRDSQPTAEQQQHPPFSQPPPSSPSQIQTQQHPLSQPSPSASRTEIPQYPPKPPPNPEAGYTTALHWRNAASDSKPRKRPTGLPSDVEHITEVEWADDAAPSATHAPRFASHSTNVASLHTNVEKAPRPKTRRPEPCFCEPDLVTQAPCCVDTSCALFACQEECTNGCACGPLCGNKRIQRKQWKKLSVFDAGLKGRGLMVQGRCRPGDFIVEYVGVAVKKRYLDRLFARYKSERMLYIMALDGDVYIDARHRGGIARYINHSCDPNCAVHRWKVRGVSRAGVFALRDIAEGEELSFDYQWDRKAGRAVTKCHCGSANCRGTIESELKDGFDAELNNLYLEQEASEGSWLEMGPEDTLGKEIMNRVVKVYFEHLQGNGEYYIADVAQYDERTGQHLLMYRGDSEEHWTELRKEKWMLLDDGSGVPGQDGDDDPAQGGDSVPVQNGYAIARKKDSGGAGEGSLLINPPLNSGLNSNMTSPRSDFSGASSPLVSGKTQNYMYIQTPVKDQMVTRHTLFKCGRYCRVHIDTVRIPIPSGGEVKADDEHIEGLQKAYSNSLDGLVWKLVVTGLEVQKAIEWLEKIAISIQNSQNGIDGPVSSALPSGESGVGLIGTTVETPAPVHATEVIIPRFIVDEVKKRYFNLKGYCYNTDVSFSHSDSKSKQFAKMTLSAKVRGDLDRSLEYLYTELTQMCLTAGAPMTSMGVYKDLAFLAGLISADDFRFLFLSGGRSAAGATNECSEDLRGNAFAGAFEEANRCSIWVQASEDMGRVTRCHRVINEAFPNKPRKIYFGAPPSRVDALWGYLTTRVADLNRGVQFLHLGADRIYQQALTEPIKKNGRPGDDWNYFFDFVEKTSGASVRVDPVTGGSHLRIDGGDANQDWDTDGREVSERTDVAMELISLQIELFRDHHIRKQRWGFGRDWALLLQSGRSNLANNANPTSPKGGETGSTSSTQDGHAIGTKNGAVSKPTGTADSLRLSDPRAISTACLEISEIVTGIGLSEKVAAHACIIFYRYISLLSPPRNDVASGAANDGGGNSAVSLNAAFKLRDIQLASLFIANKSQKVVKWKRLEAVLERAYRVFYPGSFFNPESEEAKNWERRVIRAEKTVLTALNYDVFWPGVDWVINAVAGTKAMPEPLAENAMALALSGHVLAAGPVLWLKYGPKYAFAAICGFLSFDIEPLFPALSLQPLTVSHAAELIYNSCQALSRVKKSVSSHELFSNNYSLMGKNVQQVQKTCARYMSKHRGRSGDPIDDSKFVSSPAYKEISGRVKLRKVFRGARSDRIEERILPVLGKICFESKCTIRFSDGMLEGTNDIVLEGSWKALSIAEHLLCEAASLPAPVPYEHVAAQNAMLYSALAGVRAPRRDDRPPGEGSVIKQVKVKPGLLEMINVDGEHGWEGTLHDPAPLTDGVAADADALAYDAGWRTCVAARAPRERLDAAGLRWWVPRRYGPSLSGSLCEMCSNPKLIRGGKVDMRALALLAQSFAGGYERLRRQYPALSSFLSGPKDNGAQLEGDGTDGVVAISLQRWPPEKIEIKERSTGSESNGRMKMGFSVAALQEMQLVHQLHFLIPSPQGHPNFILPLAIAMDAEGGYGSDQEEKEMSSSAAAALAAAPSGVTSNAKAANDILALIERNQRAAGKRRLVSGSHLVLEPTPINLQKVMGRYQRKNGGGAIVPPAVLASWCHDMLSAISFCHSNHIVLRSLLPDQIHLDHSGTAKLSGLSKVMVLHGKDRTKEFDPLKYIRSKKGKSDHHHHMDDVEPFAAPELLLGGTRHTKETDMWAFGALLANLLLGKQLFPGKDRVSKMTQVFKIAGVPDKDNYESAKNFPFYSNNMYVLGNEGKKKKYNRGVEKALRHMLRAFVAGTSGDHHHQPHQPTDEDQFSGLISLIDGLLHLDPKRRMTADKALSHHYMVSHVARVERHDFQKEYVRDWLDLKENVLTRGKRSRSSMKSPAQLIDHKQKSERAHPMNGDVSDGGGVSMAENGPKRKFYSMGALSSSGIGGAYDGDDLYNLDDVLPRGGGPSSSSKKKPRH